MTGGVSVVTLVNDSSLYACAREAAQRAAARVGIPLETIAMDCAPRNWNAARGLNHGLQRCAHRWVLCIHQDVLLPADWFARAIDQLEAWRRRTGRTPAVVGAVGTTVAGRFVGGVYDPNGLCRWGRPPAPVVSLDEHLILIDRTRGLRFDPRVPGFHCYGTDLALRARQAGRPAVVIDAPVVHLSSGRLDATWEVARRWMLDRWGGLMDGVIPTPATTIQASDGPPSLRRSLVATNRRVAIRARRLRQRRRLPGAMPPALQRELVASIAGAPDEIRARFAAAGAGTIPTVPGPDSARAA